MRLKRVRLRLPITGRAREVGIYWFCYAILHAHWMSGDLDATPARISLSTLPQYPPGMTCPDQSMQLAGVSGRAFRAMRKLTGCHDADHACGFSPDLEPETTAKSASRLVGVMDFHQPLEMRFGRTCECGSWPVQSSRAIVEGCEHPEESSSVLGRSTQAVKQPGVGVREGSWDFGVWGCRGCARLVHASRAVCRELLK